MPADITCLILDDHEVVREGLRLSLSRAPHIRVVGEAADGPSAVALAPRRRPNGSSSRRRRSRATCATSWRSSRRTPARTRSPLLCAPPSSTSPGNAAQRPDAPWPVTRLLSQARRDLQYASAL